MDRNMEADNEDISDENKYSDSGISRPSESKLPEKRRSFLQPPKSYVSKLPSPSVITPLKKSSPVEEEVPKTSPIPIPQPSPPQNTVPEPEDPQEFFIGDRITIGGIKTGTLLYFGTVHLAPGLWCGIALDEKDGTHDGLVNDVRYFTCRNGHGIFAPVERVSHLDHKAIQVIVKAPAKVSHIPSKPSLSLVSPIRDEIGFEDRSTELLDDCECENDLDDDILGLDENGIIQDDEDYEDIVVQTEKPRTRRKLPAPPRPSSQPYSKLQFIRRDTECNNKSANDSSMDESGGERSQMSASDGDDTDLDVHELQHSATGSSGGEDSWSLNKDYLAMCDGKAQYLNITFDGESESKTSTQEPSEESPSPEFIFDQEMIEDGEFAAEPIEITRDASLGLISSFTLDKNDLLNELFGNEEEEDFDNGTSQGTLEPMSEEKDGTPEKQDLNMSVEFDDNDLAASTPFQDCKLDLRNKLNVNETFTIDDLEAGEVVENDGLNVTFSQEDQPHSRRVLNTTTTINSKTVDNLTTKGIQKNLNSTFTVDEKSEVEKISADISAIAGKDEVSSIPVSMVDSGISMKCSMSDSAASVRNSMADSLRNSVIDPGIRRSMLDSGISVHSAMTDSNVVLQKSVNMSKENNESETSVGGGISGKKGMNEGDSVVKSEAVGLEKGVIHKDMDDSKLIRDLNSGHQRKERPISFLSTTSGDTGYVPDTDSEFGTLTLNSPQEWMDKGFNSSNIAEYTDNLPRNLMHDFKRESPRLVPVPIESDSDFGTMTADTDNEADRIESLKSESVVMDNIQESMESEDEITQVEDTKNLNTTITLDSNDEHVTKDAVDACNKDLESTFTVESTEDGKEMVEGDSVNESTDSVPIVNISIEDKDADKNEGKTETNKQKVEKKVQKKKKFNVVKDFKKPNTTNVVSKLSEYLNTPVPVKPREEKSPKEEAKKSVLKDFKKPNITNVVSKLSEYLKTPVPVKPREDKTNTEEAKNKRNSLKGKIDLSKVTSKIGNKSVIEENEKVNGDGEKKEEEVVVEKEPVKRIKRTPPKSKWDAIMSQIDNKKETEKVKPKPEIKSKLDAFLHIPPPAAVKKEEPKPKPKRRISSAIPDYSKVQSKLKYSAPPAKPKDDDSPGKTKAEVADKKKSITDSPKRKPSLSANGSLSRPRTTSPSIKSRDTTPSRDKESLDTGRRLSKGLVIKNDRVRNLSGDSVKRPEIRDKVVHLDLADSLDGRGSITGTGSIMSSRQSSQTDMSTTEDDPLIMKQLPQIERTLSLQERRDSSSALSEVSEGGSQVTAEEIELKRQKSIANQYRRKSALLQPTDSLETCSSSSGEGTVRRTGRAKIVKPVIRQQSEPSPLTISSSNKPSIFTNKASSKEKTSLRRSRSK